jgi:superfamily I DNA and RNA helicase
MTWIVPRTRLDDEQIEILNAILDSKGNHWLRGFAGSGKSVLLVYAAMETLLSQSDDKKACIVAYTNALTDMLSSGLTKKMAKRIDVTTYDSFKGEYDFIFIDEVQDLPRAQLQKLNESSERVIVAGDEVQSIYPKRIKAENIKEIIQPDIHTLSRIYRLSETLRDVVLTILPSSRVQEAEIGGFNSEANVGRGSFDSKAEEIQWVWHTAQQYAGTGQPVVILLPNHKMVKKTIDRICKIKCIESPEYPTVFMGNGTRINYEPANSHLKKNGLMLRYLGNSYGSLAVSDKEPLVYLMTYHSAKGLDFDTVFLPYLNDSLKIWRDDDDLARRLFYVAMTRSRTNVYITYCGTPHKYISNMPQHLLEEVDTSQTEDDEDEAW